MAVRKSSYDGGDLRENDPLFDDETRIPGDPSGQGVLLSGGGRVDEFGNVVPDFSNDPNYPVPFVDYAPDEIGGNTDTAREIGAKTPNRPVAHEPSQTPGMQLPRGVSANEFTNESSLMDQGGYSEPHYQSVPSMPTTPNLVSSVNTPPTTQGPQRRSPISPAIFAQQRNPNLFGRAGGLLEGGQGATGGGEHSGAIAPTEMMKKLLQMFMSQ